MSRSFSSGSTQYLTRASAVVSGPPFTIAGWFMPSAIGTSRSLMAVYDSGEVRRRAGWIYQNSSGGVQANTRNIDTGQAAEAGSSANMSASVWNHVCGVFAATNDRRAFLNGGNKGTDSTTVTTPSVNTTTVGANLEASTTIDGRAAEIAIWNVALTDAEVAAIAKGFFPPSIRPDALVAYWPIWGDASPEPDRWKSRLDLTLNNASTKADHAPMIYHSAGFARTTVFTVPAPPPPSNQPFPNPLLHPGRFALYRPNRDINPTPFIPLPAGPPVIPKAWPNPIPKRYPISNRTLVYGPRLTINPGLASLSPALAHLVVRVPTTPGVAGVAGGSSPIVVPYALGMNGGPVPTGPPLISLTTTGAGGGGAGSGLSHGGIRPNTLNIVEAVGQIQTLDCEVVDHHGAHFYNIGEAFHVQDNLVTIFYGDIDETTVNSFESPYDVNNSGVHTSSPVGARYWSIRGTGLSHLATRRVTGAFTSQAKVPISTVVSTLAAPLGLATVIQTSPSGLALSDTFSSEQETVAEALTRLADLATALSGIPHIWTIDYPGTSFSTPTLYFQAITNRFATSSLGGSGYPVKSSSIRVRTTREQFANSAVLKLDRYLVEGGAEQTDSKLGSDIFSGTLALTNPMGGQPTVLVNGTEETVGIKDSDVGKDWYWALGSKFLRVGNSTASGSDTIDVSYPAHDLRSVTVTNAASVSAVGLFEMAVQTPDTGNVASPTQQASQELARHNGLTLEVTCTARTPSGAFKAGQLLFANLTGFGSLGTVALVGLFYCKSIRTYDEDLTILWREFTLVSGPLLYPAQQYIRRGLAR